MFTVMLISANVFHLAHLYMEDEVYLKRFLILVCLFIASIAALIFIPHITALLLGWDGLGLVSFLLVILYSSPKALGAGMLTALTNRLGDAFILLGISLIVEYNSHLELVGFRGQPIARAMIIIAAITKSAQFPFSSWLPAAMEAPTPVSALVHSSTLVTAGVYLMIRLYSFLRSRFFLNGSILFVGVVTRFFAGLSAMAELDLKKIIALSTLSQLGFIIISIGLGYPFLAFFHLITHAILKALLFVCGGILIHYHGHSQDLRRMGSIRAQFPVVSSCISISRFALCAIPFMSGFYSKDAILEGFFWSLYVLIIIVLSVGATGLTTAYSVRLFVSTLFSYQKRDPVCRFSEPVNVPIIMLSVGAIFSGSVMLIVRGPLAFESINPSVKRLFTFLLFIIIFVILSLVNKGKLSFIKGGVEKLQSARSNIMFLTGVSTQKLMSSFAGLSNSFCRSDQS